MSLNIQAKQFTLGLTAVIMSFGTGMIAQSAQAAVTTAPPLVIHGPVVNPQGYPNGGWGNPGWGWRPGLGRAIASGLAPGAIANAIVNPTYYVYGLPWIYTGLTPGVHYARCYDVPQQVFDGQNITWRRIHYCD